MILNSKLSIIIPPSITRTCGGDPGQYDRIKQFLLVLPAHAGVILEGIAVAMQDLGITRTCGGDPDLNCSVTEFTEVLPAHAGVILSTNFSIQKLISITRTCGGDPIRYFS